MRRPWDITQEAFDQFLAWLDPDREQAGTKYENIRRKLIKIFVCRGCLSGEDLADETINRVIRKMPKLADGYTGDPVAYFYGVARNVHLEHVKESRASLLLPVADPPEQKELEYQCLERCMKVLTPENRNLMLEYYKEGKQARIVHRKVLADGLGIPLGTLRLRTFRIRTGLQGCMESCLKLNGG